MSETEYERKERIDVIKEILSSKENAIKFMYEAGIVDSNGKWLPIYR
jgi:nuclear transport factor 2 (NTF2) superfamily protein